MSLLAKDKKFNILKSENCGRSVFNMKLTDSALKSLEEFIHQKDSKGPEPTIQFSEEGGEFCLPSSNGQVTYRFGFSSDSAGLNSGGTTECLKLSENKLEKMGTMMETLRVKASDDIYKRIGQKFEDVKHENMKKQTVLLDTNHKTHRRTSWTKTQVSPNSRSVSGQAQGSYSRLGESSIHLRSPQKRRESKTINQESGTSQRKDQPQSSQNKYTITHKPSSSTPVDKEIMKKDLRERIIHLLAVRDYKKIELTLRLGREGLHDKDKKNISAKLAEVSDCKGNIFCLKRTMWHQVQDTWLAYSDLDKAALKRRRPVDLTPPTSSGTASSTPSRHSPAQPTNTLKRQSYPPAPTIPKKQRVSNYKKVECVNNTLDSSQLLHQEVGDLGTSPSLSETVINNSKDDKLAEQKNKTESESQKETGFCPSKNMDFQVAYPPIASKEQRVRYKAEYDYHHARYLHCYKVLEEQVRKFASYEARLDEVEKDSKDYESLELQIKEDYSRNKEARNSFQYLHPGLGHIQKMIMEYDKNILNVGGADS